MRLFIGFASAHGATAEIAERLSQRLRARGSGVGVDVGLDVECRRLDDRPGARLLDYDAVVIGSAVHSGVWLPEAQRFLEGHARELVSRPVWLFSVGMPAAWSRLFPSMGTQEEGQLRSELFRLVDAEDHQLFSGVLRQEHLSAFDRVRFRLLGGRYGDFRDWQRIDDWADSIADRLSSSSSTCPGPVRSTDSKDGT